MWKTLQHMPLIVKSKRKQKKLLKQEIQLSIFFFFVFSSILIIAELGLLMEPSPKIAV